MLVLSQFDVYWEYPIQTEGYNLAMARGWESKSVEEQIAEREESKNTPKVNKLTANQREIQQKREQLLLMRTKVLTTLQTARNEIYRRQQEEALKHLDAELARIGEPTV